MRDTKRIYEFCNELANTWATKCPDWRFGQLMMNILGEMSAKGRDPFFPEEKEMMDFIKNFLS